MRAAALNEPDARRTVTTKSANHPGSIPGPTAKAAMMAHCQERTMEQEQTVLAVATSGLSRLCRFVLFVLTGGFAFPHVCTEGMELSGSAAKG